MLNLNFTEALIRRRPALLLGAVTGLCCLVFFGSEDDYNSATFTALLIAVLLIFGCFLFKMVRDNRCVPKKAALMFFGAVLSGILLTVALLLTPYRAFVIGMAGAVSLTLLWGCFIKRGTMNTQKAVLLLFAAAFLIRLVYVLYTGIYERQHDVETFGGGIGHAGYIEYFYNNARLPDFDVRDVWQFYHPPLHHILAAVHLRLMTFLGVSYEAATESLQMLTLYYSMVALLVSYRILRELQISEKALIAVFAVLCFHPTFVIFSGSINNDILSVSFSLAALLYAIRWYKQCTFRNILKIALCIGLGMMTKLSSWMVAPAVAFLFLLALIKNSQKINRGRYFLQFLSFGAVCLPLGLWWSVRNYLLWNVPPSYVPRLEVTNFQYIGDHSVFDRLFNFNFRQFSSVYDRWGDPYFEFNPTVGLLKTAMFGEYINGTNFPSIIAVGFLLFWLGVILAAVSVFAYFAVGLKDRKMPAAFRLFLLLSVATVLVMYYYFCLDFPFTCTQNIRYAAVTIPIGAAFIGRLLMIKNGKHFKFKAVLNRCIYTACGLFCLNSAAVFLMISLYR